MNENQKNEIKAGERQQGFLKLIVLIVIALIVLNFLGFNIDALWNDFIFPVVKMIWDVCVWFANVLYSLLKVGFASIGVVVDIINQIIGR